MSGKMLVVMTDCNFVARYTGCCRQKHAEKFLIESRHFKRHLDQDKPTKLVIFTKILPCAKTCVGQIIRFYQEILEPLKIQVIMHVASLYKTIRTGPNEEDDLRSLHALMRGGIEVQAFKKKHWMRLASLCSKPILLTNLLSEQRCNMDTFIDSFLHKQHISWQESKLK